MTNWVLTTVTGPLPVIEALRSRNTIEGMDDMLYYACFKSSTDLPDGQASITLETDWTAPIDALEALAAHFPYEEFTARFTDEIGEEIGVVHADDGQLV